MDTIEFWFDFGSGYAFFAQAQVSRIERETGCEVLWRPFMLGTAFKVTGAQGLSRTPMKGDYARRDWQRLAALESTRFMPPPHHPVVALAASRIFYGLDATDRAQAAAFARSAFRRYYCDGEDITTDAVLRACLTDAGAPHDALGLAVDPRLKAVLKERSEEALAKGVFGSPFFLWRTEPFWGADRIAMLIEWVRTHKQARPGA